MLFGLNIFLTGVKLGLGIGFGFDFFFASEAIPYILVTWVGVKIFQMYCNHKYGPKNS